MFFALAVAAVIHVQPGDTLSGIAASHGVSLAAVEQANPQIANPNLIYAGQRVNLPGGGYVGRHRRAASSGGLSYGHPNFCGDGDGDGWDVPCLNQPQPISQLPANADIGSDSASTHVVQPSGDLASVPGVPRAFAACVAFRESSNGTNQAFNGGVYGIIRASGINVNGQSIGAQKAAFSHLYALYGKSPWSPSDHC
jgi:LysM repeat protein